MPLALEDELHQIADLEDIKLVKDKRSRRKGILTSLRGYALSLGGIPLEDIRVSELQKKLDEAVRSFTLCDALQEKFEELSTSISDFDFESERSQAEAVRSDNEELIKQLENRLQQATLYNRGDALLEAMEDFYQRTDYSGATAKTKLSQLDERLTAYREITGPYRKIDEISQLRSNLGKLFQNIMERVYAEDKSTVEKMTSKSTVITHVPNASKLNLDLPTFSGKPIDWVDFHRLFTAAINKYGHGLIDEEKSCHLLKAMKIEEAQKIVQFASTGSDGYKAALQALEDAYGRPRLVYPHHVKALLATDSYTYDRKGLRRMRELWEAHLRGLERCKGESLNQFLATIMFERLDSTMKHEWMSHATDSRDPPTIGDMLAFFKKREFGMEDEEVPVKKISSFNSSHQSHHKKNKSVFHANGQPSPPLSSPKCSVCREEYHPTFRCPKFLSWDQSRRHKHVKSNSICLNCLSNTHLVKDCYSQKNCRHCKGRHNSLLHRDTNPPLEAASTTTNSDATAMRTQSRHVALLSTAMAMVSSGHCHQKARTLLDSGASLSLVTERLVNSLGARRHKDPMDISGVAGGTTSKGYVQLTFASVYPMQQIETMSVRCYVVPDLPAVKPPADIRKLMTLPVIKGKTPVADPQLGGAIDVLLGITDFVRSLKGFHHSSDKSTVAFDTIFGWTLGGEVPDSLSTTTVYKVTGEESRADEILQRFWELDQVPENSSITVDEQTAIDHFHDTHQVLPSGRFAVRLPRRSSIPDLGESRSTAIKRYLQNERSLKRKGQLKPFEDVLAEYGHLDHAELVPAEDISRPVSKTFYLPVHGVAKETSTTTKLRAVFDASAKTSTGVSLNDQLLPGPNVYPLLTTILNRFRMFSIAVSADISKMFREITLHPEERDFHRFLLRDSSGTICDWRMKRLAFGVTSSPFLATKVLHQLADNFQQQFPRAAAIIRNAFYVDDCLTGAETVQEAAEIREELCQLLQLAGMVLRKWRSNSDEFLTTVPENLREKGDLLITEPTSSLKTLGIHWDVKQDNLHVSVPTFVDIPEPTKRDVASSGAKVFDLMGWYSPAILPVKVLLQRLWSLHLGWDEPIPSDLAESWNAWKSQLSVLSNNPIPRRLFLSEAPILNRQLHGFADASSVAYGGVVYLRITFVDTTVSVSVLIAKTRVAPLKTRTIPQLELCAAVLTAKLLKSTSSDISIPITHVYGWSDSSIALEWIKKSPVKLTTFVAHRVSIIQDLVPANQWRHVPTADNPADVASRGALPKELINHPLWWHGPPWLHLSPSEWPPPVRSIPQSELPEVKATAIVLQVKSPDLQLWHKFSSFTKLLKIVAWCKRFADNCRKKEGRERSPTITSQELSSARKSLFRVSQLEFYKETIDLLQSGKVITKVNSLFCLSPHIDSDQLLHVGGRVRQPDSYKETVNLVILNVRCPIVRLMLTSLHEQTNHSGPSTLLAILAENYYIVGVKRFLKGISKKCVTCQRAYARTLNQRMGMLPSVRTKPTPPFTNVGVDFAGPFIIKRGNPRRPTRLKSYVCLFICMSTKAVHLELCSDLTTEAFMAGFTRFCARRGTPSNVYSDNGSNFQGASNSLHEMQVLLRSQSTQQKISDLSASRQLHWHFNPSRAPHFGGLWEAGVRAMKAVMKRVLTDRLLNFEEMTTVLHEVEATMNSRPILPLDSTDHEEPSALTPGHFLIGRPIKALPVTSDPDTKITSLRRWNLVRRLSADLWKQWHSRYLQTLQARSKWLKPTRNFAIGDIVLVKDDTITTRTWPLAIVIKEYPGTDGLVRVVDIRCNRKVYKRAINRLVLLLPTEDQPAPGSMFGSAVSRHEV